MACAVSIASQELILDVLVYPEPCLPSLLSAHTVPCLPQSAGTLGSSAEPSCDGRGAHTGVCTAPWQLNGVKLFLSQILYSTLSSSSFPKC